MYKRSLPSKHYANVEINPTSFSIRNKLPSLFQFKSGMRQKGNVMVICGKVLIYAQFGLAVKALMDSHLPRVSFTAIHYGCRSPCTLWYQGVAMIITPSTLYKMLVTKSLGKI